MWAYDNCDYQTVDVTATEYKFAGIPNKLKPGRTMFRLTNDGAEVHEIVVFNIKTKTPLKKLLGEREEGREGERCSWASPVRRRTTLATPTCSSRRAATRAVCFVPIGATDPNTEAGRTTAPDAGDVQGVPGRVAASGRGGGDRRTIRTEYSGGIDPESGVDPVALLQILVVRSEHPRCGCRLHSMNPSLSSRACPSARPRVFPGTCGAAASSPWRSC